VLWLALIALGPNRGRRRSGSLAVFWSPRATHGAAPGELDRCAELSRIALGVVGRCDYHEAKAGMRLYITHWTGSVYARPRIADAIDCVVPQRRVRAESACRRYGLGFAARAANGRRRRAARGFVALLLMLSPWPTAWSQSGSASYQVPRQTIDAGAGVASSATHSVVMSIGQADAGAPVSSASYQLHGGFLRRGASEPAGDRIFADGFEN
jgi:hypothetical protein